MPGLTKLEARAIEVTGRYARDVIEARHAMEALGADPRTPEWEAFFAAKERWASRPRGRSAPPGDLDGFQPEPRDYPNHGIGCRRCNVTAGLEGHPFGCPRTPSELLSQLTPMRLCYCGQTMVAAPEVFGACCEQTPPVRIPGGCCYCGSDSCEIGNPDDLPEKQYHVTVNFPETGNAWVHPRCYDADLLARAADGKHFTEALLERVEIRRRKRHYPLGLVDV